MKFEVELAEKADRDLRNIFFYIAVDLSAPENAERQINRLWDAILSLEDRKSTRLNSSHRSLSRMPSSA